MTPQMDFDTSRDVIGKDGKGYTICTVVHDGAFRVIAFCEGQTVRSAHCDINNEAAQYDLLTDMVVRYSATPPLDFI